MTGAPEPQADPALLSEVGPCRCLSDPLSIEGLRRLAYLYPRAWQHFVQDALPLEPSLEGVPSVGAVLAAGLFDRVILQRWRAAGFRKHRDAARLACSVAADLPLDRLDDARGAGFRGALLDSGVAPPRATGAATVLRRLARR